MPLTFFAHQAPFLPLARRWQSIDALTFTLGTMAPDIGFVLAGSRFAVGAHAFPWLVVFCAPITLVATWLVARVLAPVVPVHLPDLGVFHLHDYRGLARHRFRAAPALLGAALGPLTHAGLDWFTHDWGWPARQLTWYRHEFFQDPVIGRHWTTFRVLQYVGHVGLTTLCILALARYGRGRWLLRSAEQVPRRATSLTSHLTLWILTAVATLGGLLWVLTDSSGGATDILRVTTCAFGGLVVGATTVALARE